MRAEYGHGLFGAPEDTEHPMFQWLHVRPGDYEQLVVGKRAPLWYMAHWVDGRMQPCPGGDCRWCHAGIGRQRRWVFAVARKNQNTPFLWEVSDALACVIRGFAEQHGQIENLQLTVRRENGGAKARLSVECSGLDQFERGSQVTFPEISEALELTWTELSVRREFRSEELRGKSEY